MMMMMMMVMMMMMMMMMMMDDRIRVLDLNQGQGWHITYDPKPKLLSMPLQIEFEILPCELDVPFQGTPQVHVGIPHMNFGGPLFPKILRNNDILIAKYLFSRIF